MNFSKRVIPGLTTLPKQDAPFLNDRGELNASSKADLINQITGIITAYEQQSFRKVNQDEVTSAERKKILMTALENPLGEDMMVLGQALTREIEETTTREGFARRILKFDEVAFGEILEISLKTWDVTGFLAVSPSEVTPSLIRSRRIQPPEFHIPVYILIDTIEIAKSPTDLLEEKYEQGLEAVMTNEDRLWKKMADSTVGYYNEIQYFSTFTRSVFASLIELVSDWGIPPTTTVMSSSLWQEIIASDDFVKAFAPVTNWELLQEGNLGTMYGTTMLTDHFRQANQRVLNRGEIYVVGAPVNHGVITIRGDVNSKPIDKNADGQPKEGWFIDQITSLTLANAKAVSVGKKI